MLTAVFPAGVLHGRAADIYSDSAMLVAVVEDAHEQRRLHSKLNQLRDALDRRVRVQRAGAWV